MTAKLHDTPRCCPTCGRNVRARRIVLYAELVATLFRVYQYLRERDDGYLFTRREIKRLFKSENDTARFGDLIHFGGLIFKERRAHYGINLERCQDFFMGRYTVPAEVWIDPLGPERIRQDGKLCISEVWPLWTMMDQGEYTNWKYRETRTSQSIPAGSRQELFQLATK